MAARQQHADTSGEHAGSGPATAHAVPEAPSIFISYRRDDAAGSAGRLHSDLKRHFGMNRVFRDRDMRPGTNWVKRLRTVAGACHVMLAVIGPRWSTVTRENQSTPRLSDPRDALRIELQTALARDEVTIIPVLVDGAIMPEPDALPAELAELCEIQAFTFTDQLWDHDLQRLTAELEAVLGLTHTTVMAPSPQRAQSSPGPRSRPVWWPAPAGAVGAAILAAPLSATLARQPTEGSAGSLPLGLARERIAYYALERAAFWGLVGMCVMVALSLAVRSHRGAAASALAGMAAGAFGGAFGGLIFQAGKYLANPQVSVLDHRPAEWLLQVPNVTLPAVLLGWVIAGGTPRLKRYEGALIGLALAMVAVALKGAVDAREPALVIEATLVTAPLILAAASARTARIMESALSAGVAQSPNQRASSGTGPAL